MNAPATAGPTAQELADADTIGMTLSLWARHLKDAPAVLAPAGDRSFSQLNANTNRLARALRSAGLSAGDSLALLCSNRAEFVEVSYACARIGVRYTPINWHLAPDEVAYIVEDCDAQAVIAEASCGDLVAQLPDSVRLRLAVGGPIPGFVDYDAALAQHAGDDIDNPVLGTRMLYTSGTTGKPKGVAKPPASATAFRASASFRSANYAPGDVHLCTGPLYHAAPLAFSMLLPLAAGASISLMQKWDARRTLELMTEQLVTHTHMVPTMFHRMLRLDDAVRVDLKPPALRQVMHGAAACPVHTKQAMMDWLGPVVWEYYAATEGAGSFVSPEQWLQRPGTVGLPPTPDHVKILSDDHQPVAPGEVGTVYLKLVAGAEFHYHKSADKTAASRHGSHYTLGDVGYLDEDGYLFLTDRSANLIISGGVNIYPAEVEAVLSQHPAVLDVGVIGVPSEEWGEEVRGVVELTADAQPGEALGRELVDFCRAQLAHFKCPRSIDFVDALPRHDNGKLYKRRLRERYR